jgi:hypothetical protein
MCLDLPATVSFRLQNNAGADAISMVNILVVVRIKTMICSFFKSLEGALVRAPTAGRIQHKPINAAVKSH